MYILIIFILFYIGYVNVKHKCVTEILPILCVGLLILSIENYFFIIADFLSEYSLFNTVLIVLTSTFIWAVYHCIKYKKCTYILFPSIIFIKWLPLSYLWTCSISIMAIILLMLIYKKLKLIPLLVLLTISLSIQILENNHFKAEKIYFSSLNDYKGYEVKEINNLFEGEDNMKILSTSHYKLNNIPFLLNQLEKYMSIDWCINTKKSIYRCSYYNITANKKEKLYDKLDLNTQFYKNLGFLLIDNTMEDKFKKQYLNDNKKLILVGMLDLYQNYKYIYQSKQSQEEKIVIYDGRGVIIKDKCLIEVCENNKKLMELQKEIKIYINNNNLKGEILIFNIENTKN